MCLCLLFKVSFFNLCLFWRRLSCDVRMTLKVGTVIALQKKRKKITLLVSLRCADLENDAILCLDGKQKYMDRSRQR